ncbi:MAG: hypothetical protein J4F28_02225 [Nitrosopumilaceae archaeon]|nr:hypothetical protein [Nitrosopumilaceae archaeon]
MAGKNAVPSGSKECDRCGKPECIVIGQVSGCGYADFCDGCSALHTQMMNRQLKERLDFPKHRNETSVVPREAGN